MEKNKQVTLPKLSIKDIVISENKKVQESYIMEVPKAKKTLYVYIKINNKEYPVLIDEYQRECKATSSKLSRFVRKSRIPGFTMYPPFRLNIRTIDGVEYISFVDGYQRLSAICMILKAVASIPIYGSFKKWDKKDQDAFLNYSIPYELYNNLTYEEEVNLFNEANTDVNPVTEKEIRMSQTSKEQEDKINMLRPSCKQLYSEEKQKAKKNDTILRLLSLYINVYNDVFEDIKIDAINEKNNQKIMNLITKINDKEYRRKIQPLIKKCNLITGLMSNSLEGDLFKYKNKTSKYFNTDTLIYSILKYCKDNPEDDDLFEDFEYGPMIREAILNVYLEYEGKTNTNLKVIDQYSQYIYDAIKMTIEEIKEEEEGYYNE